MFQEMLECLMTNALPVRQCLQLVYVHYQFLMNYTGTRYSAERNVP